MTDPFTDQADAAYREVAAVNAGLADHTDSTGPGIPGLRPLIAAWLAAEIFPGCEHARAPIPLIGILTRPGLLFCMACSPAAKRQHAANTPDVCDACGTESEDRRFFEVSQPLGAVGWLHGWVCAGCRDGSVVA